MSGGSVFGLKAMLALVLALTLFGVVYVHVSSVEAAEQPLPQEIKVGRITGLEKLKTEITAVDDSSITVIGSDGQLLNLFAKGRWIILSEDFLLRTWWNNASNYVGKGEALLFIGYLRRENGARALALGIKQGEVILLRPVMLRLYAKNYRHTGTYMGSRGKLVEKGENYMVLEVDGRRMLAVMNGVWVKAGGGEARWSDVSDEFRVGDTVRLFCHNILIMYEDFSETFGIDGFIWGYSGAVIDLTSGITLSRR